MRAAFLPYPGDPFLLNYWLHFFDTVWGDEIDRLYIHMNSPIEQPVVDYIKSLVDARPKITMIYKSNQIEHGKALDELLEICQEDYIMWVEDDGFIFKKGQVDRCFKALESGEYDIVGSKRGSCHQEILSRGNALWGTETIGEGDSGCNFWPNFFFTRKELLLKTDRDFGAHAWHKGDVIKELGDYTIQDDVAYGDTFVWGSLQLHAMVPPNRILYVNQYHGSPDDLDHFQRSYNLFDGIAPWCHIGSLSSGVGGLLQDGHGRSLARRLIDESKGDNVPIPNYCNTEQEKNEFERRVQWWLRFWQYTVDQGQLSQEMANFAILYKQSLDRIISEYGLSMSRIERRQRAYSTIGL